MNKNIVSYTFLIALVVVITFTSLLSPFEELVVGQVDPSQERIEPIPPSNNTNQTAPIVTLQSLYWMTISRVSELVHIWLLLFYLLANIDLIYNLKQVLAREDIGYIRVI